MCAHAGNILVTCVKIKMCYSCQRTRIVFCLYEKVKFVLVLAEGESPGFIEKITLNGHLLCSFSNK